MKQITSLIVFFAAVFVLNAATYTVPEHQQALVFQLGQIARDPVTKPGLHFKLPFVQDVRYYDKRVLQWDGEPGEIPTLDRKFIWVDTTARWRISDALKFYQSVRDINNALPQIGSYINGATKDIISDYDLIESVRNSNDILGDLDENKKAAEARQVEDPSDTSLEEITTSVDKIRHGREQLSRLIIEKARKDLSNFGIALIDVQIRSIAYKEVVEQRVYERMTSERQKIATKIRSVGEGERQKVLGQLDLALKRIESQAYKTSQSIRGKADAKGMRILAQTLQADPEYYEFIKTLEAYEKTLGERGEFILSTDSEFFKLFKSMR